MTTLADLLTSCGPAVPADTLSEDEVARAIREGRAMRIHVESCMGTQQSGLTTRLFDLPPDVVFARPIPAHLHDVEQLEWDSRDDVLRWLDFIPPRRKPGRPRRAPKR